MYLILSHFGTSFEGTCQCNLFHTFDGSAQPAGNPDAVLMMPLPLPACWRLCDCQSAMQVPLPRVRRLRIGVFVSSRPQALGAFRKQFSSRPNKEPSVGTRRVQVVFSGSARSAESSIHRHSADERVGPKVRPRHARPVPSSKRGKPTSGMTSLRLTSMTGITSCFPQPRARVSVQIGCRKAADDKGQTASSR